MPKTPRARSVTTIPKPTAIKPKTYSVPVSTKNNYLTYEEIHITKKKKNLSSATTEEIIYSE